MLEKLWDDVVAGPRPETGLEKLRKATTARPLVVVDKGTYSSSSASDVGYAVEPREVIAANNN